MSVTQIKTTGTVTDDARVAFLGHPAVAAFGNDLFASYLTGSGYPVDTLDDYAYNNDPLTRFNAPTINEDDTTAGSDNGFLTGFDINDWIGAGDSVSFFCVVKRPVGVAGRVLVPVNGAFTTADYVQLSWSASAIIATRRVAGSSTTTQINDTVNGGDAHRGNYEFIAGVWTPAAMNVYRRHSGTGGTLASNTNAAASVAPSGTEEVLLGARKQAETTQCVLVSADFVRGDHSADVEAYYSAMSAFLAGYGVTV